MGDDRRERLLRQDNHFIASASANVTRRTFAGTQVG
jgi:hypothetical protein